MVEAAVVGGDDLVVRLDHLSVDEALDAVLEHVLLINGLHAGLGDFQHDGPVWALLGLSGAGLGAVGELLSGELDVLLGLVVWRVVGEDGGTVEWAVILGEVEPALVTNALWSLATETDTNNVGGRVEEALAEIDELLVAHGLNERIDGHGVDELLVVDDCAVVQVYLVAVGINLGDPAVVAVSCLGIWQCLCNSLPDTTGTVSCGEAEGGVGTPVSCGLVVDDVVDDTLDIGGGDTLSKPLALHLGGGHGPDLEVVWPHEEVGDADTHLAQNPLVKVLGLGVCHARLECGVNQAVDTLGLVVLVQHGQVVLEWVGDPLTLAADVGHTLVGEPVVVVGEGLVDAVVEVFVVGEDDMATDVVELGSG
jgi:hypothetical protein